MAVTVTARVGDVSSRRQLIKRARVRGPPGTFLILRMVGLRPPRSLPKGVYYVAASRRWRAALRVGPVLRHLGYFGDEAAAAAAVAAAEAAPRPPPQQPPSRPSVPGVAWHEGKWLVRGVAGSFETLVEAEEAAHRKPRVQAMRGSVPRRGRRPGASGDKARSFLILYTEWSAGMKQLILSEQPWRGMGEGAEREVAVKAELKARWRAGHGRERAAAPGGNDMGEKRVVGAGAAAQNYHSWARQERVRLMSSKGLVELDRVERAHARGARSARADPAQGAVV